MLMTSEYIHRITGLQVRNTVYCTPHHLRILYFQTEVHCAIPVVGEKLYAANHAKWQCVPVLQSARILLTYICNVYL